MFRYLRYLILAAVGLALLIVALANRTPVLLKAMPDDFAAFLGVSWQIELPVFVLLFSGIVIGVLVGFLWEWAREHKHRATASTKTREVSRLERELATMRDATSVPQDDVIALLDRPKAK
ncbi:phosphoribosylanthranilate isomerase [Cypionkella aquatica]|uniref:Phosphoribosylanthranilate isomerase n=1 Tax=Cypionkella aquatica TaxID=1756042 RepID=A0AA37X3D4_9RHOB|nr:LapA family protein [Cypionkella aquatica]GLS88145.1 phosphoribosylanthranilate isomerase [Cypionkella aquatica]